MVLSPKAWDFRCAFTTDSCPNSDAKKMGGTRLGLWFARNNTLPCRDPTAHFAYPVGQSRVFESATRPVVVPLFMAFGWLSSRDIPRVSSRSTSGGKFFPHRQFLKLKGWHATWLPLTSNHSLEPSSEIAAEGLPERESNALRAVRGWTQEVARQRAGD
jgi:hypothetical protein